MSKYFGYKTSPDGVKYLDFSDFVNTPCGTILKNEEFSQAELKNFIKTIPGIYKSANHDKASGNLHLIEPDQKHTAEIVRADNVNAGPADGAFTSSPRDILTIRTADCMPVFLYDGETVGLLHIGWRGCLAGIIENFFREASEFNIKNTKAAIGPGIGQCCFKVSPEVALLFEKKYCLQKENKFFVDLMGFIVDELAGFGIEYILKIDACTVCDNENFHSYRREGKKFEQMISYIYTGGR